MNAKDRTKPGYLYLLIHPDLPEYFKFGYTTKHPQTRLKEHNSQKKKFLGQIVQRTAKLWQLIYYVPVTDVRRAENYFYSIIPRFGGLELMSGMRIEGAIEQELIGNHYLDKARYIEMQEGELHDYNINALLDSMRVEWARDGLAEACDEMLRELKEERKHNDRRYTEWSTAADTISVKVGGEWINLDLRPAQEVDDDGSEE